MLTIEDLGVLRGVSVTDGAVTVELTPTYSGCPALDAMRDDVVSALTPPATPSVTVDVVLAPAWTTDWMSDAGKAKLRGVRHRAPAPRQPGGSVRLGLGIRCPRCGSLNTREVSRFGSTSCKALYECQRCLEPFDYFKAH